MMIMMMTVMVCVVGNSDFSGGSGSDGNIGCDDVRSSR